MKLNISNLDWNNATVLEFKYIYALALMVQERTNDIGINTLYLLQETSNYNLLRFSIDEYEPCGFFRYKQLYDIYMITIYLGRVVYFNPDTLNNSNFKNGKRIGHFGYSVEDLSEIAHFDFYKNPLVPNQRLTYYDRFLKPLYLVLKEYKKIWINQFFAKDGISLYVSENLEENARTIKHGIEQPLVGQDYLDFFSLSHAKNNEDEITCNNYTAKHDLAVVGGIMKSSYAYIDSRGYIKEEDNRQIHDDDYFTNYDGLKFLYYATMPETQIYCTCPLLKGVPYQLYLYACTYPLKDLHTRFAEICGQNNKNLISESLTYENPPYNLHFPYGNYFLLDSGTTTHTFNTFDIELPEKFPYSESIFSNYPLEEFGSYLNYIQADYVPYSYDRTLWEYYRDTPTRSDDGQRELREGAELKYIGPHAPFNNYLRTGCIIEWWYKPLLIVDYSSKFSF